MSKNVLVLAMLLDKGRFPFLKVTHVFFGGKVEFPSKKVIFPCVPQEATVLHVEESIVNE